MSALYTASCRLENPKILRVFFPLFAGDDAAGNQAAGNQAGRGIAGSGGCSGRNPPVTFNVGELVRITFHGKTVSGEVLLASDNGLSLALLLQGHLEGYSKLMPVLWLEDHFVDLLLAEPVTISPFMTQ
jgi:hypothetical protein